MNHRQNNSALICMHQKGHSNCLWMIRELFSVSACLLLTFALSSKESRFWLREYVLVMHTSQCMRLLRMKNYLIHFHLVPLNTIRYQHLMQLWFILDQYHRKYFEAWYLHEISYSNGIQLQWKRLLKSTIILVFVKGILWIQKVLNNY
jgi:hypothetical protein